MCAYIDTGVQKQFCQGKCGKIEKPDCYHLRCQNFLSLDRIGKHQVHCFVFVGNPNITVMGVFISWEILASIFLEDISCLLKSVFIFCRSNKSRFI